MGPPLRQCRRALASPSQWRLLLQRRDLTTLLGPGRKSPLQHISSNVDAAGASLAPIRALLEPHRRWIPNVGPTALSPESPSALQRGMGTMAHHVCPEAPASPTRMASLARTCASLAAEPPSVCSSSVRGMSTYVGHGSGGRAGGPGLHEPPESHPFAVKGLNHIALAVPNVAAAAEHYRTVFGAQVSDAHDLPEHGVKVVFVHIGLTHIELLEPLGEGSPIAKFLEKHPRGGLHHLCFTVDNIEVASRHVSEEGVRILGEHTAAPPIPEEGAERKHIPEPKIGAHGAPVIFLDPRDNLGVLCELEQVTCFSPNDAHHC